MKRIINNKLYDTEKAKKIERKIVKMNKYQWIVKIIDYIILIGAILLTTNGNFQLAVVIFLYCIYSRIGLIIDLIIIRKGANYDR